MQTGRAIRKGASTKPLRDAALVVAFLAMAATATVSVDTGTVHGTHAAPATPASEILAPNTHATESLACPEQEDGAKGGACLQASLDRFESGLTAHEDLVQALRSLGIRIENV